MRCSLSRQVDPGNIPIKQLSTQFISGHFEEFLHFEMQKD